MLQSSKYYGGQVKHHEIIQTSAFWDQLRSQILCYIYIETLQCHPTSLTITSSILMSVVLVVAFYLLAKYFLQSPHLPLTQVEVVVLRVSNSNYSSNNMDDR